MLKKGLSFDEFDTVADEENPAHIEITDMTEFQEERKKPKDALVEVQRRMEMDRTTEISSFEECMMADPFDTRKSMAVALERVREFDFYTDV
jgi:hypothetical protein